MKSPKMKIKKIPLKESLSLIKNKEEQELKY